MNDLMYSYSILEILLPLFIQGHVFGIILILLAISDIFKLQQKGVRSITTLTLATGISYLLSSGIAYFIVFRSEEFFHSGYPAIIIAEIVPYGIATIVYILIRKRILQDTK